jgi:hypothetical protein
MTRLRRIGVRVSSFALISVGLMVSEGTAIAQSPTPKEGRERQDPQERQEQPENEAATAQAIARFKRGQELYAERNFAAALIEFRRAYELSPNYRVLFNVGQVCYQMQDYVCAHKSLERYLMEGGDDVPADRRSTVTNELSLLKQRIGFLSVRVNVEGAEVLVDDVVVGTAPTLEPLPVSAGRHRIVVVAPGRTPATRSVDVAGQDTAVVEVTFADPIAQPVQAVQPETTQPRWTSRMTTLSWLGYGVGAAALVGGGIVGGVALNNADTGGDTTYNNETAAKSNRDKTNTLAITSDALLASGLVAVAVTTVFTFVLPRTSRVRASSIPGVFTF